PASVRNPDADFNLVVSQLQPDGSTIVALEKHRNLTLDSKSPQFVESVVNNASAAIRVKVHPALTFPQTGFAVSGTLAFPLSATDTTIGGTLNGDTPFLLTVQGSPWANIANFVTSVNNAIATLGLGAKLGASETGADGQPGTDHLRLASLTAGESSSVVIATGSFGGLAAMIHMGFANGGREFTGAADHRPAAVTNTLPFPMGADGTRGSAVNLLGSESAKTGIYALLDVDLFNILCIPETFDMLSFNDAASIVQPAVALCE